MTESKDLPLYVAPSPFPLGSGKVTAIVSAAGFLAHECRLDNESSRVGHVGLLGRSFGQARHDIVESADALSEPFCRTRDAGVLPHHEPDFVGGHLSRVAVH